MAASNERVRWLTISITLTLATISASTVISVYFWRKKSRVLDIKLRELRISLKASLKNCAAERQGRIRAQQDLRKALLQPNSNKLELTSYPMVPIGIIHSCFSTRNGTPRQPLLVPLARASLIFDPARVPPASLEGLEEYSHCWIIYVFHLNTDLDKLWKHPSKSKFKAKVKVPKLKGGKMGVFATRAPHRPCPIGLTVAKVEAVKGNLVLLSGVDLVDGTPVLDVKPYLPYCDSIHRAKVPKWVEADNLAVASVNFAEGFSATLADCWTTMEKKSLYESPDEFKSLIGQVLSWDIRSLSQRSQPHDSFINQQDGKTINNNDLGDDQQEVVDNNVEQDSLPSSNDIIYHLILEGLNVAYRIDSDSNVHVCKVALSSQIQKGTKSFQSDNTKQTDFCL